MTKLNNLTGQRFGKLTVISRVGSNKLGNATWKCKCDCGNETIVIGSKLLNGWTKSCSKICFAGTNLIGQRFGKLIVIRQGKIRKKYAYWLCKCNCGNKKEVRSDDLRKGNTTSCGCLTTLPFGESSFLALYKHYKKQAIQRNYLFELTQEEFRKLTKENCYFCNSSPSNYWNPKHSRRNGGYDYNGVDRLDNTKGYTKENSVPCCYKCNRWKSDITIEEFIEHCKKIIENYFKKIS